MKAIVQETYGPPDVLELRDIAKPLIGDDDVLILDRTYPLRDVPEAIRSWERGHARGKVVITV